MTPQNILDELTSYGFEDIPDTEKMRILNDVLGDLCSREPWPFLETVSSAATVDSAGKVGGLTDIQSVLWIVDTSTGQKLRWMRWDAFTERFSMDLAQVGSPYVYFFQGNDVYTYPIDTTPTLRLAYIRVHPTVLQNDAESAILLPPRHHWVLVEGCLIKLFAIDDDVENVSAHRAEFEMRIGTMRQDLFKKQWDSPDTIRVLSDDDDPDIEGGW